MGLKRAASESAGFTSQWCNPSMGLKRAASESAGFTS